MLKVSINKEEEAWFSYERKGWTQQQNNKKLKEDNFKELQGDF